MSYTEISLDRMNFVWGELLYNWYAWQRPIPLNFDWCLQAIISFAGDYEDVCVAAVDHYKEIVIVANIEWSIERNLTITEQSCRIVAKL